MEIVACVVDNVPMSMIDHEGSVIKQINPWEHISHSAIRPARYSLTTARRQTVRDKGLAWLLLAPRHAGVTGSRLRDAAEHKSQMATLLWRTVAYSCICRVQETPTCRPRSSSHWLPEVEPVWKMLIILLSKDQDGKQPDQKKEEFHYATSQDLTSPQPLKTLFTAALFSTAVFYRCIFGP